MQFNAFFKVLPTILPKNHSIATRILIWARNPLFWTDVLVCVKFFSKHPNGTAKIGTYHLNLGALETMFRHFSVNNCFMAHMARFFSSRTLQVLMILQVLSLDHLFTQRPIRTQNFFKATPVLVLFVLLQGTRPLATFLLVFTNDSQAFDVSRATKIAEYSGRRFATVGATGYTVVLDASLTKDLPATLHLVGLSRDVVAHQTKELVRSFNKMVFVAASHREGGCYDTFIK